jgi:serine protease Do
VVTVKSPRGVGSGFIIDPLGHVITNFHVIKGQKHISIIRFKKVNQSLRRIVHNKVQISALDSFHDLAVLRITDSKDEVLPHVFLMPEEQLTTGEKVFVIGNPLGLERSVTEGVLSHTGRNFGGQIFLQIDSAINPGNSGGPLFNSKGEVIGVINMGISRMQGLNFAIPIWQVKFLLNHIDLYAYNEANPLSGYFYAPPPANPLKKKQIKTRRK